MISKLIQKIRKFLRRDVYIYKVDAMDGKKYVQLSITTIEHLGRFRVDIKMNSDYTSFQCINAGASEMGKVCEALKPFAKESDIASFIKEKITPHWGNWYY